ncbi:hypothetical protein M9H77_22167 [Catharanthus roseus]|uniref:Uncharacterized protein n=1 Tax=Catharanthus roseus TaxID=4058 RepID=A0ACC0APR5_CATRO|nr:hypothetical protein M9H77_22167 [Catharanthus roseus]
MKMITTNISEENNDGDSFALRADAYYQKRPQLLALLQDLYNSYVSLADRYCQTLAKSNHHRRRYSSPISPFHFNEENEIHFDEDDCSDVESSLSYHPPPFLAPPVQHKLDPDMLVADLVMKSVDYDIVLNEMNTVERKWGESSRKAELQKSLLDVLESERLILLNENASLGFRVNALLEENKGLASESLFMKRKAAELARCVLKMREDHRVCILSQKIEDLQGQIYGLEKRNKEYYEQLVKTENEEEEKKKSSKLGKVMKSSKKSTGGAVTLDDCFRVPEEAVSCFGNNSIIEKKGLNGESAGKRATKIWDRVKKFDIFMCVPHVNSTTY